MTKIAVIGTGYVGLTTGACLAHLGHEVVCADIDERKIEILLSGRAPFVEDGLDRLVEEGLENGNLRFVVGAKHAVLTAKHGCGFLLWPTDVTLPNGDEYGYSVGRDESSVPDDVLRMFIDSCTAQGIGAGFYYSLTNNFYLNVASHYVQNTTLVTFAFYCRLRAAGASRVGGMRRVQKYFLKIFNVQ